MREQKVSIRGGGGEKRGGKKGPDTRNVEQAPSNFRGNAPPLPLEKGFALPPLKLRMRKKAADLVEEQRQS